MNTQVAKAVEGSEMTEVAEASADVSASEQVLAMIAHASTNGSIDIEAMKAMMQMRKDLVEEQAEKDFNQALAAAQLEMEPVARDARNNQTNSNYARLEAIAKAITPIRAKHGFSLLFGTGECPDATKLRITCDISHSGGHTKQRYADLPADMAGIKGSVNKTAIHAFGSTMTYGRRYLTLLIFDIATEDDDGNAASETREKVTDDQVTNLRDLLQSAGRNEEKFCKYLGLAKLTDIYADKYNDSVALINRVGAKESNNGTA